MQYAIHNIYFIFIIYKSIVTMRGSNIDIARPDMVPSRDTNTILIADLDLSSSVGQFLMMEDLRCCEMKPPRRPKTVTVMARVQSQCITTVITREWGK